MVLGDNFELVLAFSRDGPKKVYVQHRLKERAKEINELLEKKAYFYVCGDAANMAREVNTVLAQILSEERGIPEAKAEEIVKNMRASNQYQVRFPSSNAVLFLELGTDTFVTGGCLVINRGIRWASKALGFRPSNSAVHARGCDFRREIEGVREVYCPYWASTLWNLLSFFLYHYSLSSPARCRGMMFLHVSLFPPLLSSPSQKCEL